MVNVETDKFSYDLLPTLTQLETLPPGVLILCEGRYDEPSAWLTLGLGKAELLWGEETEDLAWFHMLAVRESTRIFILGKLEPYFY